MITTTPWKLETFIIHSDEPHSPPHTPRNLPSIPPPQLSPPPLVRCSLSIPNLGKHPSLPPHSSAADDDRIYAADISWLAKCCPDYTSQTSSLRATRHNSPASESPTSSRSSSSRQLFRRRGHFVRCIFRYRTTQTKIS